MKHFIQNYLLLPLILFSLAVSAQYRGGIGKGNTVATFTNAPLGRNIFFGGTDDGVSSIAVSNQQLGRNIFLGGINDGVASVSVSSLPLGRNIFLGGNDDGFASAGVLNQSLGRNIFLGGPDDGYASAMTNVNLGKNIFLGGANDGWAMAFANVVLVPVTLSAFSAKWQQNDALITWQTALEMNTSIFELQRSFDGISFTAFHTEPAAGQSSGLLNYQYADAGIKLLLPAGVTTVYYRLRTIDLDGKSSYSAIVILRSDRNTATAYAIYPNPAKDIITISTTGATVGSNSLINMFNMSGRILLKQKITNTNQQVSVAGLAAGTYFLQLTSGSNILYTQKIIIQK